MPHMPMKIAFGLGGLLLLGLAGCGTSLPPFTDVEGTVAINGKPLPNADVRFVPMLDGVGAEAIATARTDANGHYRLKCGDREGACVGLHKVIITESAAPAEFRRMDAQDAYSRYLAGLKNRPIPLTYASLSQTLLEVEVTPQRQKYDLELKR